MTIICLNDMTRRHKRKKKVRAQCYLHPKPSCNNNASRLDIFHRQVAGSDKVVVVHRHYLCREFRRPWPTHNPTESHNPEKTIS